jgi:hypothetical protein
MADTKINKPAVMTRWWLPLTFANPQQVLTDDLPDWRARLENENKSLFWRRCGAKPVNRRRMVRRAAGLTQRAPVVVCGNNRRSV